MKKELSVPLLVAVIAVVILIVGLIGWKVFSPSSGESGSPEVLKAAQKRKEARE